MPPITTMEMVPVPIRTVWLPDAGPASPLSVRVCLASVESEA